MDTITYKFQKSYIQFLPTWNFETNPIILCLVYKLFESS